MFDGNLSWYGIFHLWLHLVLGKFQHSGVVAPAFNPSTW